MRLRSAAKSNAANRNAAAKPLQARSSAPKLPSSDKDLREGIKKHGDEVFLQPFTAEQICDRITSLTGGKRCVSKKKDPKLFRKLRLALRMVSI